MVATKQNATPTLEPEVSESFQDEASSDVPPEMSTHSESISLAKQDIEQLLHDLPALQQALAALSAERKKFVLPARARGDKSAQHRIDELDAQISCAERELRDHKNALETANQNLRNSEADFTRAAREQKRDAVLAILDARDRCDLEAKLTQAIDDVVRLSEEMRQRDQNIVTAVIGLNPSLERAVGQLKSMYTFRTDFAAAKLQRTVPVAFNSLYLTYVAKSTLQDRRHEVIARLASQIRKMEVVNEDVLVNVASACG
jgi:chromosome segregation ATPase